MLFVPVVEVEVVEVVVCAFFTIGATKDGAVRGRSGDDDETEADDADETDFLGKAKEEEESAGTCPCRTLVEL